MGNSNKSNERYVKLKTKPNIVRQTEPTSDEERGYTSRIKKPKSRVGIASLMFYVTGLFQCSFTLSAGIMAVAERENQWRQGGRDIEAILLMVGFTGAVAILAFLGATYFRNSVNTKWATTAGVAAIITGTVQSFVGMDFLIGSFEHRLADQAVQQSVTNTSLFVLAVGAVSLMVGFIWLMSARRCRSKEGTV